MKKLLGVFVLFLLVSLAVFFPCLSSEFLWDDVYFIFKSSQFLNAPNPFSFWILGGPFSKNWPLAYSVLWVIFKVFGSELIIYKLLSIFLHSLVGFFLWLFLKKLKFRYSFWAALVFLVHPFGVEVNSWVIQFNTLLAMNFGLLGGLCFVEAMSQLDRSKRKLLLILFYSFSLLSLSAKPVMIGAIFSFIFLIFNQKVVPRGRVYQYMLPLVMLAFLSIGFYQHGIQYSKTERADSRSYVTDDITTVKSIKPLKKVKAAGEIFMGNEKRKDFRTAEDLITSKITLMAQNFSFYLGKFFIPVNNMYVYPKNIWPVGMKVFAALMVMFLFFVFPVFSKVENKKIPKKLRWSVLFATSLFIPISGLLYIPYMKFSFVSDRWGYVFALGLVSVLFALVEQFRAPKKWLVSFFVVIIALLGARTITYGLHFSDKLAMLEHNQKLNPRSVFLHKYLAQEYFESYRLDKARFHLSEGMKLDPKDEYLKYLEMVLATMKVSIPRGKAPKASQGLLPTLQLAPKKKK
jgi:hypothetical protein